ncbi:unnamed protein product, partial [Mesorhabditis belari]|uniref:Uncharacterized protein n=1 Tax=Mesorhabditis belari TaxID=2138241 RepID=A0AAF3EBT7_9BILA
MDKRLRHWPTFHEGFSERIDSLLVAYIADMVAASDVQIDLIAVAFGLSETECEKTPDRIRGRAGFEELKRAGRFVDGISYGLFNPVNQFSMNHLDRCFGSRYMALDVDVDGKSTSLGLRQLILWLAAVLMNFVLQTNNKQTDLPRTARWEHKRVSGCTGGNRASTHHEAEALKSIGSSLSSWPKQF